jgi:hypothetical protein
MMLRTTTGNLVEIPNESSFENKNLRPLFNIYWLEKMKLRFRFCNKV